ncbi:unnamed protein product [Owenia fusiformis]|uniref:dolichyl-phosphate-mannose--protein mannosyltransferase n=1 Tax=Owenia fusiformis TaxID=6347 RepID=A0A8S4Q1I6_OWEFU|nr:unnamed protein product [Owenia fusiformis]
MESSQIYSAIVVLAVTVCYYNALECGFVFDDASAIKENKDLRPKTPISNLFWNDFWGTPMPKEKSHKSYRPLCVLTFRLNYAWGELDPVGYHLVNVILHAAVCLIFMRVCCSVMSELSSFLAALLFAVHPVHTEAVTGVVGRAELLSSIFFLAAIMAYSAAASSSIHTDWKYVGVTLMLVAIATLCKEQGITVVAVCCVYDIFVLQKITIPTLLQTGISLFRGKPTKNSKNAKVTSGLPPKLRRAVTRAIVLLASTLVLLVARIKVMGAQLPVFTKFDNPASAAPTPSRQLTYNYLLSINAWLLLFPKSLCCDWTMGTIPVIQGFSDPRNLATLLFYAMLGSLVYFAVVSKGQRTQALILGLAMLVLPFIPASNLFFPVGFVVAERILYLPSMGFTILVTLGFEVVLERKRAWRHLLWLLMACMLLAHGARTVVRNRDWYSEYTLFKSALEVNKDNAKLYNNVGHALENEQKFEDALGYFLQAASVQPDDIGAHINVGRTYNNLNNTQKAEEAFRVALSLMPPIKPGESYTTRIAPNHLSVFVSLGNLVAKDPNRLREADQLYRSAISMRADYIQAYINRGDILLKLNKTQEAEQQYEVALRYEHDNPDIHYNLGVVLIEQGRQLDALKSFDRALNYDPEHKQTLFNSAVLMQEIGDPKLRPEAFKRLHEVMPDDPDNEKIYFNLGMLAMDDSDFPAAEKWFKKAIQLVPNFRSALFNIALLLTNDLNQPLDAMPYLEQLLQHYPEHTKGLILMGDININHKKDIAAAEKNFARVVEINPKDVQGNHNLCVVYVEQGDLLRAEQCLKNTLKLAPGEGYIKNHLDIVQTRIKHYRQQQEMQQKQLKDQKQQKHKENK